MATPGRVIVTIDLPDLHPGSSGVEEASKLLAWAFAENRQGRTLDISDIDEEYLPRQGRVEVERDAETCEELGYYTIRREEPRDTERRLAAEAVEEAGR